MAGYIPTDVAGGFKYTPVSYSYGSNSQVIAGGLSFDMPLSTVATFTNAALDFSANNSKNAQGFFAGIFGKAQENLTNVSNQAFAYQTTALQTQERMFNNALALQKFAVKKQFQAGILNPTSGCFITTAVTAAAGLPDDCHELQTLRKFRDDYMLNTDEGKALVKLYYLTAPAIVAELDKLPNSASVYNWLLQNFIHPAIQAISREDNETAQGIYTALYYEAAKLAGVESTDVKPTCTCNAGKRAPNFHAKTCPVRG